MRPLVSKPSLGAKGGVIGQPRKLPPDGAAARVRELAANGHSKIGIANHLDTCVDVFSRWLDEYPEIKEAFEHGREKERHTLHNVLYKAATEQGNIVACIFLLKARHGYKEGDQGAGPGVNINIAIPGAMSMKDFLSINNEPADKPEPIPRATALIARRG